MSRNPVCTGTWMAILLCVFGVLWSGPLRAQEDLTALEEQAMRAAVDRVAPSVVRIEALGGLEQVEGQLVGSGPTTGLVVSEEGHVISSAFAFAGQPTSILVTLPSGKRLAASIVARDQSRMLVLLKVNTDEKLVVPVSVGATSWRSGNGRSRSAGRIPVSFRTSRSASSAPRIASGGARCRQTRKSRQATTVAR